MAKAAAKTSAPIRCFDLRNELRATASRRKRLQSSSDFPCDIVLRLADMFPRLPRDTVEATCLECSRLNPNYARDQLVDRVVAALLQVDQTNDTPRAVTCYEPVTVGDDDFAVDSKGCEEKEEEANTLTVEFEDALDDNLAAILSLSDPDLHPCVKTLNAIFSRISEHPEDHRFRRLKRSNPRFEHEVGRHDAAIHLLKLACFIDVVQGDTASIEFVRDPATTAEFVRVRQALLGVAEELGIELEVRILPTSVGVCLAQNTSKTLATKDYCQAHFSTRQRRRLNIAELTEHRLRDPRGFREAAQTLGIGNRGVVSVHRPGPLASAADTSTRQSRHFTLADIDRMRVNDEISNMPNYAEEYRLSNQVVPANDYGTLVSRSYDPELIARQALDGTNRYRASKGLAPLRWHDGIAKIARDHAKQMASGTMPFSHEGFDQRVCAFPVAHRSAAENLALNKGMADVAKVAVDGWIQSPGHEKNLRGAFNLCGIGASRASDGTFYLTQLFAHAL